jgi:Domain of unknown function (DUF5664)
MAGDKHDAGKEPWSLVPFGPLRDVVRVLGFGASKYGAHNWRGVSDARGRYFAAAQRHMVAWWTGEVTDAESGLPHLAHAVCCLLFLMALEPGKPIDG